MGLHVIPPISYADFEKVLAVLPEPSTAKVRVFNWDGGKLFDGEYSIDNMVLEMEVPLKSKIFELVKDSFEIENKRHIELEEINRKLQAGEEYDIPSPTNVFTFDSAAWYLKNLRVELNDLGIELYYSDAESADAAKEIFDKLYNIPSLNIKLVKHKWTINSDR